MFNKNGFSLLSFLLYLMLFSVIALFTTHIITTLLLPSLVTTRACKSVMALHIASDLFVRDIRAMKNKPHRWKSITSQELIWHTNDFDIGWHCIENRVERSTGIYDQGWKSKKTSLVATGVAQGTFVVERNENRIIGVEMSLIPEITPKKAVICYVAVK
jgi:hypothetical protein